jgi:hypothetical protein
MGDGGSPAQWFSACVSSHFASNNITAMLINDTSCHFWRGFLLVNSPENGAGLTDTGFRPSSK